MRAGAAPACSSLAFAPNLPEPAPSPQRECKGRRAAGGGGGGGGPAQAQNDGSPTRGQRACTRAPPPPAALLRSPTRKRCGSSAKLCWPFAIADRSAFSTSFELFLGLIWHCMGVERERRQEDGVGKRSGGGRGRDEVDT